MKKQFVYPIFLFLLFLMVAGVSSAQTVYVTKEGKKYHKKNCTLVKEGKKGMNLDEAKMQGLLPCHVCKPDQNQNKDQKKTETVGPKLD